MFDLDRPCRGSLKEVFRRPCKTEKVKRYPACSPEEKHLECLSVAASGLLLCALARMWNSTSTKSGEDTKLCNEAYLLKTTQ